MTGSTAPRGAPALPLVVWMNAPSPYQEDLFRALTRDGRVDLRVVYDAPLPDDRRQLGWQVTLAGYAHQSLDAATGLRSTVRLARSVAGAVHIVNGLWAVPRFVVVLFALLLAGAPALFIYTEASGDASAGSGPRRLLSRMLKTALTRAAARWPQTHILAISRLAEDQFATLGFPPGRVYPFGYFSSKRPVAPALSGAELGSDRAPSPWRGSAHAIGPAWHTNHRLIARPDSGSDSGQRLVFVGQLIRRKGVDVLLAALQPLWQGFPDLTLDVLGEGPLRATIEAYARTVPRARISLLGACPSADVARHIAGCDLLVLPSRYDGWGMVVNEALMVGTPVLATDRCGAADLIVEREPRGRNGFVVAAGDVGSLRRALVRFLETPAEQRASLRRRAGETGAHLDAGVAAAYLVACIEHARAPYRPPPTAPWLERVSGPLDGAPDVASEAQAVASGSGTGGDG